MTGKIRRLKIPKLAVEPLLEACEEFSGPWKKSAGEIFEYFLGLMKRYEDYFFMEPWPDEYDHHRALSFTDDDLDFLLGNAEEFWDRRMTVCLRKNMFLKGGFMGFWGMVWTDKAIDKEVFGQFYKEVFDEFVALRNEGRTAGDVLTALRKEHGRKIIHDSLIDFLKDNYPDAELRKFIDEVFELLHGVEGLPLCSSDRCCWYMRTKYGQKSSE